MKTSRWFVGSVVLSGMVLMGCTDRSVPSGQNNSNQNTNGNSNTNTNTNSNNNNQADCRSDDDCVVAVKHDECCACPRPASPAEMAADPCLLLVGTENIPEECNVICPAIPCQECPDVGKTAACRDGRCEWFEGHCSKDEDCVVGIRTDDCCTSAMPVNKADIDRDECLTYWPIEGWNVPQSCYEQWDPVCEVIDCAPNPPRSRAVACKQEQDGNMCRYVDECATREDCAVLVDTKVCCPCPQPWPVSMKTHDPCLVEPGTTPPAGCAPTNCPEQPCPQCVEVDASCQDHQCVSLVWDEVGEDR